MSVFLPADLRDKIGYSIATSPESQCLTGRRELGIV